MVGFCRSPRSFCPTTHGHLWFDTAFAAILGSTVGGLTTFATTFLNQRYTARRDMWERDVANREKLYSEFLTEVADLYIDSLNRTLDDVGKPAAFVAAYALLGRIRMISTEAVLKAADRVIQDIIEAYNRPSDKHSGIEKANRRETC